MVDIRWSGATGGTSTLRFLPIGWTVFRTEIIDLRFASIAVHFTDLFYHDKLGQKSTPALTRGCFYYQHCRQMVATFDFVAVIRRRSQQACYRAD